MATATIPDDAAAFVNQIGTLELEEVPYRQPVIDGTTSIPADIADAMDSLLAGAVERKGKQEIYTMYDKFGIPSRVDGLRVTMMLKERDPRTGKPIFYARVPADAPKVVEIDVADTAAIEKLVKSKQSILAAGRCDACGKLIAENPHMVTPMPLKDTEDAFWRVNQLKFPHMYKRHRQVIPRFYRDKQLRDALLEFAK